MIKANGRRNQSKHKKVLSVVSPQTSITAYSKSVQLYHHTTPGNKTAYKSHKENHRNRE